MRSMRVRIVELAVLAAIVLAMPGSIGAAPADEDARLGKIVAKIGSTTITVGDIESRVATHMRPSVFEDELKLRELVDAMVDRELLVQEAKSRKMDERKRVKNHLKRILYNQIQTTYVASKLPLEAIGKEEIQAYYDAHATEYNQPTLVRAYQVVIKDKAQADTVLAQAKQEGMDLRKFKALATERSEDEATKKRGGDLRYFDLEGKVWTMDETVPKAVAQAAFTIEILVRASVIVTTDPAKAKEAHDKAMLPGLADAAWKKLVAGYSIDEATRVKGGDLGLFTLEGTVEGAAEATAPIPADVARAAFSLREPGNVYPKVIKVGDSHYILRVTERKDPGNLYPELVQTELGYHVLWIVNRRPAVHKSVEEMEPSIRQRLWQEKKKTFMENLVVELKKKYKVETFDARLDSVTIDLSGQAAGATGTGKPMPTIPQPGPGPAPALSPIPAPSPAPGQ